MKIRFILLAVVLACAGCGTFTGVGEAVKTTKSRNTTPAATEGGLTSLVAGNSTFAFKLYQSLSKNDGNLIFSPYSISTALAMTYAGARGETEKQMAKTLHFGLPQDKLHPAFNALDLGLVSRGKDENGQPREGFKLVTANALWGQKDYTFLPQFTNLVAENYGAGMRLVDYKKDAELARKSINNWISDKTQGKIEDMIPRGLFNNMTRLVLTNAIYFKDKWAHQFKKSDTKRGPFTLLDGSEITTDMMSKTAQFGYAQGEGYQAVELPYQANAFSMVILLPDKNGFKDFESSLTAEKVMSAITQLGRQRLALTLPKYKFDATLNLASALSALGMPLAFNMQEADFSGMTGKRDILISGIIFKSDIFVSEVLHKALVIVDEEGTEAAAATAILMQRGTGRSHPPLQLIIDRPFIFLIRDTKTGTILFLGRVLNPQG